MLGSHTDIPVFPIGGEAERKWGGKAPQLLINSWDWILLYACTRGRERESRRNICFASFTGDWGTGWKAMKRQCVDSTPAERLEVDTAYSSLQLQRRKRRHRKVNSGAMLTHSPFPPILTWDAFYWEHRRDWSFYIVLILTTACKSVSRFTDGRPEAQNLDNLPLVAISKG